jgi:acetyl esterase/lipase
MVGKRKFLSQRFASGRFQFFNQSHPPQTLKQICTIRQYQVNNRNVFELSPRRSNASGKHLLYFHGGAFVSGFLSFHWKFLASLVERTCCTISAPDYPLAPDYTYKESFAMAEWIYAKLLESHDPRDLILMGDSAGGGFALSLAQKLHMDRIPQPDQIILLSPWIDLTLSNPQLLAFRGFEPFLGIDGLRNIGKLYAGDTPPDHYLLSPVNGPLDGLAKISLFIGTKDILLADARKLKYQLSSIGESVNYFEYEEMAHAWMFLNFPESKKAREQLVKLIT